MADILKSSRKVIRSSIALTVTIALVVPFITGCTTTPEFKPTASVMVGAHKTL